MDVEFYRTKIFEKLCESYQAVYLLLPDENKCIDYCAPKKKASPSKAQAFLHSREPVIYTLDEILCYWVENNVSSEYRHLFSDYIGSPEKIRNFKTITAEKKIVFKSVSEQWFEVSFIPFLPEEFFFSYGLLVTIVEVPEKASV